jgi:hypothetical protein
MSSVVFCGHPVAYGESIGAWLCLASCFFPVIYREAAFPYVPARFFDCTFIAKRIRVRSR